MARKELKNLLGGGVVNFLTPATRTADAGQSGSGVDLADYNSALILYIFGASGDTLSGSVKIQATLKDGSDNSTWAAADAADYKGTLPLVDDPAEDDAIYSVAYIGPERYILPGFDFTGTHTNGIPCSIVVIRGHKKYLEP